MLTPVRRTGGRNRDIMTARPLRRRIAKSIGADGNPLRRPMDKFEVAARIVLVIAFLVLAALLTPLTGRLASSSGMAQVRQDASWRQIRAVVRHRAPQQFYGYGSLSAYWVPARWTAPSGARRSGLVPVKAGTPQGAKVDIWVTAAGRFTGRSPMTPGIVGFRRGLTEYATLAALAVLLLGLIGLLRLVMNRRRMAYWEMEWACFGPRWSTRRWPRNSGN
jgi:hypothetical protein